MTPDETLARRITRRRFLQGSALTLSGLALGNLLAACGGTAPGAAPTGESKPRQGGTAVFFGSQEGAHLIPSFSSFSTVIVPTVPFFNGLTKPGRDLAPAPDLAESWTVSPDSKHYVFKLRQGVLWHDGQPFTAHDVKFTWELIAHPDNKTSGQLFSFFDRVEGALDFRAGKAPEIGGVKVVDDHTIEVRLVQPSAPFFTIGSNQYIVPRHILKDVPVADMLKHSFARAPIGTGPFQIEGWKAGDSIVGKAFEKHFAGRPHLDKIVFRFLPAVDQNTLISGLKSGELHAVSGTTGITLDTYDLLQNEPSVRTVMKPGQNNQYIEFNLKKPFFEDLRVRKALSYALNRKAIADAVWKGRSEMYNSVFATDWWPTKKDTTLFDNDPEQAKRLLDEAGWTVGADGIREKNGVKFRFKMHSIFNDWPLIVQQQWRQVGVDVQHEFLDFATLNSQFYSTKTFDAVAIQIVSYLYSDPHYPLPGYFNSKLNRNGYNNPKSDELIDKAAGTNDQEERKKYYYEWQEVIAQDVPHLWLGTPRQVYAYSANLHTPDTINGYFDWREVKDWYFTK